MNFVVGNIPEELIQRATKHQNTEPQLVMRFMKGYQIVQEHSAQQVVDRIHTLLRSASGITYSYYSFRFTISVKTERGTKSCEITIYRNIGEFKKPRITTAFKSEMIPDGGKPQFAIEYEDLTRYFNHLFRYIINNYSTESPEPFHGDDLNYGLCSSDDEDETTDNLLEEDE
jgi:hypothetical protein